MNNKLKTRDRVQSVFLTLDDGKTYQFSGKVCCEFGEEKRIVNIKFGEPSELPDDCSFSEIKIGDTGE